VEALLAGAHVLNGEPVEDHLQRAGDGTDLREQSEHERQADGHFA
jgi:hypothetical protein